MVGTARAVATRSEGSLAVALYTLQAQESRVLWFRFPMRRWFSGGGPWTLCPTDAARRLEARWQAGEMEMRMGHPSDALYMGDGVGRYTNDRRGDLAVSPLHDSVAWLAVDPQTGWDEEGQRLLPPAAAVEYLQSTAVYGIETVVPPEWSWRLGRSLGQAGESLAERCVGEANQKKYSQRLHESWRELVEGLSEGLRGLVEAKCSSADEPPPGVLLHSVEVQRMCRRDGGGESHFALSGPVKAALTEDGRMVRLLRMDSEHGTQPYWLLNHAMRSAQAGDTSLVVTVSGSGRCDGRYEAHFPCGWSPGDSAVAKSASGVAAAWRPDKDRWEVSGELLAEGEVSVSLGTFMLRQVTPLMWYLEQALQGGRGALRRESRRLYRGLLGVQLDAAVYSVGRIVLWSQFSSSSADMSVAQGFTGGGSAVIFTIVAPEAVCVAEGSRFQREREYLFPSNTRFAVEASLGKEFASMLGMSVQMFELRAVSWREAVSVRMRGVMSAIAGEDAARRVASLFEVAQALEDPETDVGLAARVLLSPDRGMAPAPEAHALLPALCAVAGLAQAEVATEALRAAAKAGKGDDVKALTQFGADFGPSGEEGSAALHIAAASGAVACIVALLDAGSSPAEKDGSGRLPCEV
eukprot:Hpha_TRINITY_DN17021_c1_g1::TRINITY_DN17021_c1_g1_i3::g.166880::m.166880